MPQFQPMKTTSLIFCWVLFENILDLVYEIIVNTLLKLHSSSSSKSINLSDDVCVTILIQFEVLSKHFPFVFKIWKYGKCCSSLTSIVRHFTYRLFFINSLRISPPWLLFILILFHIFTCILRWYTFVDVGLILASRYPSIWLRVIG